MPIRLKLNSVAMFGFAAAIVLAEYKIAQLSVSPFRQDPCDAVWHFALFVMLFTLVVSTLRTVRPNLGGPTPRAQYVYLIRSQQAFVLALLIALSADIVALIRHPSMWINADWQNHLLAWLSVFVVVAAAMELLVRAAQPTRPQAESRCRTQAKLASLLALTALVFCPEYGGGVNSTTARVLTVIVGGLVVFTPIHYLLPVLVPHELADETKAFFSTTAQWYALLIGIAMGAFAFWVDAHRTGVTQPLLPTLSLGGPVIGLLNVYAFLAEPLGLTH
jgi:hypothetical protein